MGPGDTALFSGSFRNIIGRGCSTEAELMAIANGLHMAKKITDNAMFVFVTDSFQAINFIERARIDNSTKLKRRGKILFNLAKRILNDVPACCELRVNKVRAHTKGNDKRSYVNDLVDKAARKAMREKRNSND